MLWIWSFKVLCNIVKKEYLIFKNIRTKNELVTEEERYI